LAWPERTGRRPAGAAGGSRHRRGGKRPAGRGAPGGEELQPAGRSCGRQLRLRGRDQGGGEELRLRGAATTSRTRASFCSLSLQSFPRAASFSRARRQLRTRASAGKKPNRRRSPLQRRLRLLVAAEAPPRRRLPPPRLPPRLGVRLPP